MQNDTKSAYEPDTTIGEIAERWADGLRQRARKGKGIYSYGSSTKIAVSYTLAGGGPGANVTIIGTGEMLGGDTADLYDVVGGTLSYYEMGGSASVEFDMYEAQDIYDALQRGDYDEDDEGDEGDEDDAEGRVG